ncbi:MAG: DegV family protein [Clostridia bacterium]|nr:DegV family protein [Clostridia bacterium]
MNKYVISCCSTADLKKSHFESRNIKYICFHYELNGKQYYDDLGESVPFPEFYKAMSNGAETKTSQVSLGEFQTYFENFLQNGLDIIHLSMSSGLSGAFNAALVAKKSLAEKYPERKIYIVDSLSASSGYGLIMDKLADLRDSGMGIEELYNWIENNKLKMHHWFFTTDLTFFIKGGRVSKFSGTIGKILNICPLLNVDKNGKLIPRFKIRGKNNVINKTVEQMKLNAESGIYYNDKCYISHSACYSDAKVLAEIIERDFNNLNGKVQINDIGTTIGSHTGPGTVALFFWGNERVC